MKDHNSGIFFLNLVYNIMPNLEVINKKQINIKIFLLTYGWLMALSLCYRLLYLDILRMSECSTELQTFYCNKTIKRKITGKNRLVFKINIKIGTNKYNRSKAKQIYKSKLDLINLFCYILR